ncbi:TM2 domain-containing protein [Gemmiger formicilis]|nr:TM2 domain-containing protein [Gemmiger formicilis]
MFGAHRFYAKQWITAVVYLLTCWTGFSFAMTLIDVMVVVPMKTDEKGILYL